MADIVGQLADKMTEAEPSVQLRIGVVTAIESTGSRRLKTDQTDDTWLNCDKDSAFAIGDRVWMMKQKSVFLVGGRLSGEPAGVPIGTMLTFAGSVTPPGWLRADGAAISRSTYSALFAALGTVYGAGNGTTTFNLPDLDDRVLVGSGFTYSRGQSGGASTVVLSTANLPAHTHGAAGDHQHTVFVGASGSKVAAGTSSTENYPYSTTTHNTSVNGDHTHSSVGSGTAHENMPPFVAMPMIIRVL
jgi:microcystin-dependent protein